MITLYLLKTKNSLLELGLAYEVKKMSVTKPEVHNGTRPDAPLPFVFTFLLSFSKIAIHVPISN